jgi:cytoplasmic iron level regulating protein YaaA (DUF328/UPF0246 family)
MLVLLSPSKTQNFEPLSQKLKCSLPAYKAEILQLIATLQDLNQNEIGRLMSISPKLAELNYLRFRNFKSEFNLATSKPALFAFEGDVYTDIEVSQYSDKELEFANHTLRILSGLYGILKPLDLIQPYRLEMKTKLKTSQYKDLYQFWDNKITKILNQQESDLIINLASEEYFKVIQPKDLKAKLVQVSFKENKAGTYKIVAIYAKKARGTMANFIVKNQITDLEKIKKFNLDRYSFNPSLSSESEVVFTR